MSADRHSLRALTPDTLPRGDVCAMTRQRLVEPLPVAYALLGGFFLAERLLRQGPEAASLEAGQTDQGTTRAIGRAFGQSIMALAVAPLLNRWRLGRLAASRLSRRAQRDRRMAHAVLGARASGPSRSCGAGTGQRPALLIYELFPRDCLAWSGVAAMVAGLTVRVWAQLLSNFLGFSLPLLSVSLRSSYHPHLC